MTDGDVVLRDFGLVHTSEQLVVRGEVVLVRILQEIDTYDEVYSRNWLTWLWKLRSTMICYLQAGEPGRTVEPGKA